METTYAQALWTAIKRGTESSKAVTQLNTVLVAQGRETLWPKIAFAFKRIAEREIGKSALRLTVADASHEAQARKSALEAISKLNLTTKDVRVHIDDSLIGGWRLEGQEILIDASYKKDLLTIYQTATQN